MREEIQNPPIMSFLTAIKGFISGGLMGLAAFTAWDPVGRTVLFVLGFIVLVDSVMPVDRKLYVITSIFFLIIGGLLAFFTAFAGSGMTYLIILLVAAVITYLDKIRRMHKLGKIK